MTPAHRYFIAIALAIIIGSCSNDRAPWPKSGIFVGYYEFGFEVCVFAPAGSTERWWLGGDLSRLNSLLVAPSATEPSKMRSPLHIVVRGTLSPEGRYGHMSRYRRELEVQEVIEVREVKADENLAF